MKVQRVTYPGMMAADAILALAQGDELVRLLCIRLVTAVGAVEPQARPSEYIVLLDRTGLRGAEIWELFERVCGAHVGSLIAVLRAFQRKYISVEAVQAAVREGTPLDVAGLVRKLSKEIPGACYSMRNEDIPILRPWATSD